MIWYEEDTSGVVNENEDEKMSGPHTPRDTSIPSQ